MSTFNPDTFLNTTVEGELSTQYTPIPEGEFNAVVDKVEPRSTATGKAILDVTWKIDDSAVAEATGIAAPSCRQSIFLDITESGGLDIGKGKNIQLGKLRDALSQNQPGKAWAPSMLLGQVAKVLVKQRVADDGAVYTDVKGVRKM